MILLPTLVKRSLGCGLRTKFPGQVRVVGLGKGALIRGNVPDFNLEFAYDDIQPQDIELLTRELNLTLVTTFGTLGWFKEFMNMKSGANIVDESGKKQPAPSSVAAWANSSGVNVMAGEIINALEAGQHIVLSFGKHESDLDYLLVSNLLTRKIRQRWEARTNAFRSSGENEPRPLVLVVEEAHKLLNREMAAQTTFSTIARELRKYYVTLLIVDQRPSQIYDEVMSQLGTRISGWLGDDDDIRAVLSGLAGREALRGMLARLQPKEEVLILGWGVPMPLPVRSRRYNARFWEELLGKPTAKRGEKQILSELGF